MTFANKYAHEGAPTFNVDFTGLTFTTLKDLYEEDPQAVHVMRGLFINKKGNYGPQPFTVIAENKKDPKALMVSLPRYTFDECCQMIAEDSATINQGLAGFQIYPYTGRNDRTFYAVQWVDVNK